MNARQLFVSALVLGFAVISGMAYAEKPDWAGGGRGGGGNQDKGDLFGDLLVIDRDHSGLPIRDQWGHLQPIVFESSTDCPDAETFVPVTDPDSLYAQTSTYYIPLDAEGEIPAEYGECAIEAELGRLSVAKGPDEVREQALTEAVKTLSAGTISLDPAGRLVVTYTDPQTAELVEKTIDASLENIAMYEELLEQGTLAEHDPLYPVDVLSGLEGDYLDRAAAALGGAADKTGKVTVDLVVYLNAFMAIPDDLDAATMPAPINDNSDKYYDFSGFSYDRSVTYAHTLCYLRVVTENDEPVQVGDAYLVEIVNDETVMEAVFGGVNNADATSDNISAFVQAADDARAVIEFMHSHVVPDELLGACGN